MGGLFGGGADKAAQIAADTASKNNAFAQGIYDSNKAIATPYTTNGTNASNAMSALLGLNGNDSQMQALQNFSNSDGYQWSLNNGLNAVNASAFAKGGGLSGATLKSLNNYAQNAAQTEEGNYYNQLGGVANQGLNALQSLSGAGSDLTKSVTSSNNTASTAAQNAALASSSGLSSLIGTGLNIASSFSPAAVFSNGMNALNSSSNAALALNNTIASANDQLGFNYAANSGLPSQW